MKTDLVATRVIPILGDPVAQVATPRLWNEVFRQTQTDAVCVPIDLPPEGIEDFVSWVRRACNVPGFLTTTPHKAALARACDHLMPDAAFLGVVNAVRRDRDGRLTGDMFDGLGMMDAIEATGTSLKGATVAICGAGAAGSAIALQACRREVSSLSIFDIDGAKADDLIGRLRYLGAPHLQNGLPPQADIPHQCILCGKHRRAIVTISDGACYIGKLHCRCNHRSEGDRTTANGSIRRCSGRPGASYGAVSGVSHAGIPGGQHHIGTYDRRLCDDRFFRPQ